jgi:pumilio-family RNA binding repeat-containing protein
MNQTGTHGVPLSPGTFNVTNSALNPSTPMTNENDFDLAGYNQLLQTLIPATNDQQGAGAPRKTSGTPTSSASYAAHSSDESSASMSNFEKLKKRLEETEKQLHQSNIELQQHRVAKLTLENTNDNIDYDVQPSARPPVLQPIGSNSKTSRQSPTISSFGQNIWAGGNLNGNRTNAGQLSPNLDLTNWQTARSVFDGQPQESLNTNQVLPTYQEPPTPVSASFNQTTFPPMTASIRRAPMPIGTNPLRSPNHLVGQSTLGSSIIGVNANMSRTGLIGNTPPETPIVMGFTGQAYSGGALPRISTVGGAAPKLGPPPRANVPQATSTRLSPTAAEFNVDTNTWRVPSSTVSQVANAMTYGVSHMAPYAHPYADNWTVLVDKIVRGNDQQASILMQQKIKSVDRNEKHRMCEAIVNACSELMTNRFGNFLVQRVLEHGTPEQIHQVGNSIRGRVVSLSMDAFGCHVIQKAFDTVSEEFKASMVKELLRAIPDTVKHRYACHVWQKLFELRWQSEPPEIMSFVNEALVGEWWDVAMGETSSLVVQNIFENCHEEDKRPCVEEVLAKIDVIAKGQYGNWCIQHICEHGAPNDRQRAINHILLHAAEYSMDQFASKVVEKCLKIGGTEFLDAYLARVCTAQGGRPRVPLVDIACNQYGNYLIQWVLQYAESDEHKDLVRVHAR